MHVIIATTRCALHAAVFCENQAHLLQFVFMFYPKVNHSQRSSYSCMLCTKLKYIDFVVWTKKGLFIERIFPEKMFWKEKSLKAKELFVRGILPELNGRWFSRSITLSKEESAAVKGGGCYRILLL